MNFQQTVEYLYSRLPMFHRIGKAAYKADLSNTLALCEHLGNPERKFRSVHVAGTNGKGSTSHWLAAILQSAGYRTGLYTSPHLKSFTERIRLNGAEIPPDDVVRFVAENRSFIEQVQPSFFELTVGMAFDYFARQQVDVAVIEVGLGGRLDSTNVITPEVSVITNISYDHQDILGDTLPQIAAEKAGIIKPGVPVVVSERQPEVSAVFEEKAHREHAPLHFASDTFRVTEQAHDYENLVADVWKNEILYLPDLASQLTGAYQLRNLPGVLQAVEILRMRGYTIDETALRQGIAQVRTLTGLKGRWHILNRSPLTICDTAHNEGGIRQVVQQVKNTPHEQLFCVIGVVNDKDLSQILPLFPPEARYFFCQAKIPRALAAGALQTQAARYGLQGEAVADVNEAIRTARRQATSRDVIFIGGSTFVVAEIEEL